MHDALRLLRHKQTAPRLQTLRALQVEGSCSDDAKPWSMNAFLMGVSVGTTMERD